MARGSGDLRWQMRDEVLPIGATSATAVDAAPAPPLICGAAESSPAGPFYHAVKRVTDVSVAFMGLVLLSPFMGLVASLVRITSPGPVFFRQTRIGRNGIPFDFFKFRSMHAGAEERKAELLDQNQAEFPLFKMRNDPRVTWLGRIIRRIGVDELPQLYNVLKGDMSLVGPRPHLPEEVREYRSWHWGRLEVMPGISCLWQVRARKELTFNEWIESDLEYVRGQSLWLDFYVLARTVLVLFSSDRVS